MTDGSKPQARRRGFRDFAAVVGWPSALWYLLHVRLGKWRRSVYSLQPRQTRHPLWVRPRSSDIDVFYQIFVVEEYACLDDLRDVDLVIDCGANVGYSSAYFLSRFPTCQVIAVEPDAANFAMLQKNLAPHGDRARTIHAGVWSHTARLVLAEIPYGDGREWSRQVRECKPDEAGGFEGVDIGSLLASSGRERISILKVDIEGAEAVVFADHYQSWLERVDALVIELHDDTIFGNGAEVFSSAIKGRDFEVSYSGELTVCKRPRLVRH